eukprot:5635349-Heterocapsa_arctica.AAC.1
MSDRARSYNEYGDTRFNKCPEYKHDEHRVSTPENRWTKSVEAAIGAWTMAFEAGVIDEAKFPTHEEIVTQAQGLDNLHPEIGVAAAAK